MPALINQSTTSPDLAQDGADGQDQAEGAHAAPAAGQTQRRGYAWIIWAGLLDAASRASGMSTAEGTQLLHRRPMLMPSRRDGFHRKAHSMSAACWASCGLTMTHAVHAAQRQCAPKRGLAPAAVGLVALAACSERKKARLRPWVWELAGLCSLPCSSAAMQQGVTAQSHYAQQG